MYMDIVEIYLLFNSSCTIKGLKPRVRMWVSNSPLFQRPQVYLKQVFSWWGSFVNLFTNIRGYIRVYKFKEQYMNRSTLCEIKYMNRLFFFKGQVNDWGWFQNTDSHAHIKITRVVPPPPHTHNYRGYTCKRIYKFKEHYMNRSTFCEIKYMNRLFFSKAGYMIGVGFRIPPPSPSHFLSM